MGERSVENEMKINPGKSKAFTFTRSRMKDPLNYSLVDKKFRKQAIVNTWE